MTVGRDVLAERCEKFEKELEELTERREIDAGRYQFLVYAFDDQSTRYEKTKVALDACRALHGDARDALMTVGRDVLAERCEKFEKELEELTERREIDAGRYQFLVYAFDDQSTRYEKTKVALDACRAGQVVDAHYTEMLETPS